MKIISIFGSLRLCGMRSFVLVRPGKRMAGMALAWLSMFASAEPLFVERAGTHVEYRHSSNDSWRTLQTGSSLVLPVEVRTLDSSEVVITQAGSTYTLKENTQLDFKGPNAGEDGLVARVKQWIGTAFYKIERQPDEFSVETPFLVSTVKGTQFVIVTTEADSFVTLTEGSLQVLDLETGSSHMIVPGEIAGSSAGETGARTYNQQKAQPADNSAAATSTTPELVIQSVSDSAPTEQAATSAAPALKNSAGRSGDRGQGRDRGRGFAAALEAIDEVRSEQIQTRDTRSERPLTPEDIRAARANAERNERGRPGGDEGPGPGKGPDRGPRGDDSRPGGGPGGDKGRPGGGNGGPGNGAGNDGAGPGKGPGKPPSAGGPGNSRPFPPGSGKYKGRDDNRDDDRKGRRGGDRDEDDGDDD